MRKSTELHCTHWQAQTVFGIHHTTAEGRGVLSKVIDGSKCFLVSELITKCNDLLIANISDKSSDLKAEKTKQEVRKLKIDNDFKEGILVDAIEVEAEFTNRCRAMVGILDGLVSEVKIKNPDVPQAVLASINETLNRLRNEVAAYES